MPLAGCDRGNIVPITINITERIRVKPDFFLPPAPERIKSGKGYSSRGPRNQSRLNGVSGANVQLQKTGKTFFSTLKTNRINVLPRRQRREPAPALIRGGVGGEVAKANYPTPVHTRVTPGRYHACDAQLKHESSHSGA